MRFKLDVFQVGTTQGSMVTTCLMAGSASQQNGQTSSADISNLMFFISMLLPVCYCCIIDEIH
jgi:hypothetical protein